MAAAPCPATGGQSPALATGGGRKGGIIMGRYLRVSGHFAVAAVARGTLSIFVVAAISLMGTINPVSAGAAGAAAHRYRFDPLLEPPGLSGTQANGINDAGRIVGSANASDASGTVALFWAARAAAPTVLPTGGFSDTSAADINNAGQIVGVGTSPGTGSVALLWPSPTAAPTPLPTAGDQTAARGINDAGQIAGLTVTGGTTRALFWATPSASPTLLPEIAGSFSADARGINNAGQIVGFTVAPDDQVGSRLMAVFWATPRASPTELPRLDSADSQDRALGINDLGQVVGLSSTQSPMLWANPAATPAEIPALSTGAAAGINNTGVIVGTTVGPTIWTPVQTTELFLHSKGTSLFMDSKVPVNKQAESRDSTALSLAGGNPWKTIATWTQSPTSETRTLVSIGAGEVWIGLKSSDDKGARFDLRADLLKNGVIIQSNEFDCLRGAARDPKSAVGSVGINPSPGVIDEVKLAPTDTLSLRMSARIGTGDPGLCSGPANANGVRFYFDGVDRQSRIAIDFKST